MQQISSPKGTLMRWISMILRWIRTRKVPGFGERNCRMFRRDSRHFDQIGNGFPAAAQAITRNGPSPAATAIKGPAAERERQKPHQRATEDARDTRSKPATRITLAPIRSGRAGQASKV
jgi:hypothetical protein